MIAPVNDILHQLGFSIQPISCIHCHSILDLQRRTSDRTHKFLLGDGEALMPFAIVLWQTMDLGDMLGFLGIIPNDFRAGE